MNKLETEIQELRKYLGRGDASIEYYESQILALFSSRLSTLEKRVEELLETHTDNCAVMTGHGKCNCNIGNQKIESVLAIIRDMKGEE
jgi:hypothetical protein